MPGWLLSSSVSPLRTRALDLVLSSPAGITSRSVAAILRCSHATAASALARLYWAGTIDRYELTSPRRIHCYVPKGTPR